MNHADRLWLRRLVDRYGRLAVDAELRAPVKGSAPPPDDWQPTMTCPGCHAELPDFDGFGVLAHTKPAYPDGCGYCSHPALADGVCEICGVRP